jgi:hypothetical protein
MKISFYDVKSKRKVQVEESKTKKVVRKGRRFLTAKSPVSGITMWRIMGKA